MIEPNNVDYIKLLIKNICLKYKGSIFFLQHILSIAKLIGEHSIIKIFPDPNPIEYTEIQLQLEELKEENIDLFYDLYEISRDQNITYLNHIEKILFQPKYIVQITSYFENFIMNIKNNLKSFPRNSLFQNDFNSQDLVEKKTIEKTQYDAMHKVLIFEKIYSSSNFKDLSINKKAELLTLILNESQSTINNHLRMIDGNSSNANNKFHLANETTDLVLKKFGL